ncbi:MAG: hypothetical protein ACD_38C00077G0001 [uncultured bacterium]|uniref:Uncharacterized protein n=1 Tax=Candidatus Daviesbacteria bacterium GW2011_GWC2_40_12 TaxID=1618431 RepID=A0A0G0QLW4_9BACT|nr:MAG: hypothetical protein ACD_38C00077G0001 [uncultured bacterium]KKQ84390.1 MAG: hypothetical protein UT04_C0016G0011 [Candidatus Daviesbacteria bacterium GW2011_GWF2_38_7]KKR41439.1 MAG: hypothetical protein UT77_C0011G0010 [Candidatus Daviesbacteria bacterium GW2011_GWC2_40_12]OGE22203.1 MAG: hypothetical protein A2778_03605 [Candidatus Daviesbacteria bacterium RIFCSPHIGHO2_01_FULL_40_24]OGE28830.1 MAG: hypothetical protein A3C29_00940 [Candidatus Daviesbacteria bacterium RIFCSPHIGHO2_02_
MKLVIGLVGEKGSGKQTFVNFLKKIVLRQVYSECNRTAQDKPLIIRQVRFSDILAQTLIMWDIPISRANLQKLSLVMNDAFGQGSLANAARFSIEGDSADIIIFDGIRRPEELNLVKSLKNNILIYISAMQDLRYQRLKTRSEKVGETGLTFEQFLEEEKSPAEKNIPGLGKGTNLKIENNGSLEDFKQKIQQIFNKIL